VNQIIDAHQHFWKYNPQSHSWINEEMAILKRDFLPIDLQKVFQKNGIDACIAVQANQSKAETDFLLKLASEYDFIKGVVGWINLRGSDLENQLQYYSNFPKLCGFRHIIQDEPDVDFMLQEKFQQGLSLLEKYNFTYDILIFPKQLKAALQTIINFPNQKFVLDHIAKPDIKKGHTLDWEKYIRSIANHQNVYCKVSGMVTEADWNNWKQEDFTPWLDVIFDAFGNDRIMFGSDWPVCLLGGSYSKVKEIVANYILPFPKDIQDKIWGQNATNFYNIN
jgi:L-fucono-1,5-lactonase